MTLESPGTGRRADARSNERAILEAATQLLARAPDATLADIAREAGVGRVTLYGHFDSRSALVGRVVEAALARSESELSEVDLSGDADAAMRRLLTASWRLTHRHGALVQAAEKTLPPEQVHAAHEAPIVRMRALLERGRDEGRFRRDMPVAWQLTMVQAVLHSASTAVHRSEHTADEACELVVATVLGALTPPPNG